MMTWCRTEPVRALWLLNTVVVLGATIVAGLAIGQVLMVTAGAGLMLGIGSELVRAYVTPMATLPPGVAAKIADANAIGAARLGGLLFVCWLSGMLLLTSACATLRRPDGTVNVVAVLSDMRFSVDDACAAQYLPPDACTFFGLALNVADGVVAQNVGNVGVAVRQVLIAWEGKLPADSRLRPYFDVMIALLPAT